MNSQLLEKQLEKILKIPSRNYWMIRTESGSFYKDFIDFNFVAFGYNEINSADIERAINENSPSNIVKKFETLYPTEDKRWTLSANQILKFTTEIKKNDIVLIPNEGSHLIQIGEVKSDKVIFEAVKGSNCDYTKVRKVKWFKEASKYKLDPQLFKMFNNHMAIADVSDYSPYIDRMISGLFIKGENMHLALKVDSQDQISPFDLFEYGLEVSKLYQAFCKELGYSFDIKDISVKVTVESPGMMEFLSKYKYPLLCAVAVLVLIGGEANISTGVSQGPSFSIKTNGVLKEVTDFLNGVVDREERRQQMEILKEKERKLKIIVPEQEIKKTIEKIDSTGAIEV